MAAEAGFTQLGVQADIAPQWPKHGFLAKSKFLGYWPGYLNDSGKTKGFCQG